MKKALILDDISSVHCFQRDLNDTLGEKLEGFESANEALAALSSGKYSALILEPFYCTGQHGPEFHESPGDLIAEARRQSIPVILSTTQTTEELQHIFGINSDYYDCYLLKPYYPAKLGQALHSLAGMEFEERALR